MNRRFVVLVNDDATRGDPADDVATLADLLQERMGFKMVAVQEIQGSHVHRVLRGAS